MPAAGRADGKYTKKIHWPEWRYTLCGKRVPEWAKAVTLKDVTCKTCLRILGNKYGRGEN